MPDPAGGDPGPGNGFTAEERRLLRALREGRSAVAAAGELGTGVAEVAQRLARLRARLGVGSTLELLERFAAQPD
ncbi:LysR family transcriptional regulator [Kineococcus aurantiacus]|uniref:DNA-binding NarL/FixJ family response regulator n=1 Tax=Kineococcus aurantiacus TaxID=37633 RepID=A0A7Y9AUB8_9ACTN|nr:LysR family transcriptional regulator [Kineococcus aurantiacus]NYD21594.1 DNA-binding NarL/FixJ family response regulator [Kineococcus aurantiacus]